MYAWKNLFQPLMCVMISTASRQMTKQVAHTCNVDLHCTLYLNRLTVSRVGQTRWLKIRVTILLYGASVENLDGLEKSTFLGRDWGKGKYWALVQECRMNYVRKLLKGLKVRTLKHPQKGFGTFLLEYLLQTFQISWSALQILQRTLSPQDLTLFLKTWPPVEKIQTLICAQREQQHTWQRAKEYKMCLSCVRSSDVLVCEAYWGQKKAEDLVKSR